MGDSPLVRRHIHGSGNRALAANRIDDVKSQCIFDRKGATVRTPQKLALGPLVFAIMATGSFGADVDFAKIERSIGKEPQYVAKPLYALFLMDTEGRSRHWAVLDKSKSDLAYYDVLYFDTNGNGDLTEISKRFVGKYDKSLEPAGAIAEAFCTMTRSESRSGQLKVRQYCVWNWNRQQEKRRMRRTSPLHSLASSPPATLPGAKSKES
jgi:hypothetical protein